jgi:hypothetical protein
MLIALVSEKTTEDDRLRLEYLVKTLSEAGTYVGIPTPAYSEFFVDADQATSPVLAVLRKKQAIQILPFDEKAAIEAGLITRLERAAGKKRAGSRKTWQEIKFDRQILAIAKANNAAAIYSGDGDLRTQARKYGIAAFDIDDLDLPPESKQQKLPLVPKS